MVGISRFHTEFDRENSGHWTYQIPGATPGGRLVPGLRHVRKVFDPTDGAG